MRNQDGYWFPDIKELESRRKLEQRQATAPPAKKRSVRGKSQVEDHKQDQPVAEPTKTSPIATQVLLKEMRYERM